MKKSTNKQASSKPLEMSLIDDTSSFVYQALDAKNIKIKNSIEVLYSGSKRDLTANKKALEDAVNDRLATINSISNAIPEKNNMLIGYKEILKEYEKGSLSTNNWDSLNKFITQNEKEFQDEVNIY